MRYPCRPCAKVIIKFEILTGQDAYILFENLQDTA